MQPTVVSPLPACSQVVDSGLQELHGALGQGEQFSSIHQVVSQPAFDRTVAEDSAVLVDHQHVCEHDSFDGGHAASFCQSGQSSFPQAGQLAASCQSGASLAEKHSAGLGQQGQAPSHADGRPEASCSNRLLKDKRISDLYFVEVFAGCARLSKAFSAEGVQCTSVDSKPADGAKILVLNLLHAPSAQLLLRLIECRKLLMVHMAPPCSTGSRARMIQRSPRDPRPLRSWYHPDGLPDLQFADRQRVSDANKLYSLCLDIIQTCESSGVWWSLENPAASLFWLTTPIKTVRQKFQVNIHFARFHNCCYGGERRKETVVWSSCPQLKALSCLCTPPFSHQHLPWGRLPGGAWSTSAEAAYPSGLCKAWASIVVQAAIASGRAIAVSPGETCAYGSSGAAAMERASQGLFPRGNVIPPLLDPFGNKTWKQLGPQDRSTFVPGKRLTCGSFRKGATVLRVQEHSGTLWAEIGEPSSAQEFLSRVEQVWHPSSKLPPLPPFLQEAVDKLKSWPLPEVHKHRCRVLISIRQSIDELREAEDQLHQNMPPHVQQIMKPKRLLVFQRLLDSIAFPDRSLAKDMSEGFRITGWLPDTGARPSKLQPPQLHREEVWNNRAVANDRMWSMCKSSGDPKVDQELWRVSVKECQAGWAVLETGHVHPPKNCVLGRRFAVQQPGKIRPIDDMSVSLVNSTLGAEEKVVVMPTSTTVLLVQHLLSGLEKPGARLPKLTGRTFDLKSAYRQLAVHLASLDFAKVALFCPASQAPVVLSLKALPFGATGSVHGFDRCSIAIWALACKLLLVTHTVFFDDFTNVTWEEDAANSEAALLLLLRLLGWEVATDGNKALSYARLFHSLGVCFILPKTLSEPVQITNTAQRKQEVAQTCLQVLQQGFVAPAVCATFAGRLRWLEGQSFGRIGRWAFRTILKASLVGSKHLPRPLDEELHSAFDWVLGHVPKAQPRECKVFLGQAFHVFTDGAFEQGRALIGGVLCSADGKPLRWFSCEVAGEVVQSWLRDSRHPVMQSELLAVAVALSLWSKPLEHVACTVWIDSDPARHALTKGDAYPASNAAIVYCVLELEFAHSLALWFSRVPGFSNPADGPSRLPTGEPLPEYLIGCEQDKVKVGLVKALAAGRPQSEGSLGA